LWINQYSATIEIAMSYNFYAAKARFDIGDDTRFFLGNLIF